MNPPTQPQQSSAWETVGTILLQPSPGPLNNSRLHLFWSCSPLSTIHDSTYCGLADLHTCVLAAHHTTPCRNTEHGP